MLIGPRSRGDGQPLRRLMMLAVVFVSVGCLSNKLSSAPARVEIVTYRWRPDGSQFLLQTSLGTSIHDCWNGVPRSTPRVIVPHNLADPRHAFATWHPNLPLVSFSGKAGTWTVDSRTRIRRKLTDTQGSLSWAPSGARLSLESGRGTPDGPFSVWSWPQWRPEPAPTWPPELGGVSWSPDGALLARRVEDGFALLDTRSWSEVRRLKAPDSFQYKWSWHPDGTHLMALTASSDGLRKSWNLHVWRVPTGVEELHVRDVGSLAAWSPSGKHLAVLTAQPNRIALYETSGWRRHSTFTSRPHTFVCTLNWTASGKRLLATVGPGTLTHPPRCPEEDDHAWAWDLSRKGPHRFIPQVRAESTDWGAPHNPIGGRVAALLRGYDVPEVTFWDTPTGRYLGRLRPRSWEAPSAAGPQLP